MTDPTEPTLVAAPEWIKIDVGLGGVMLHYRGDAIPNVQAAVQFSLFFPGDEFSPFAAYVAERHAAWKEVHRHPD